MTSEELNTITNAVMDTVKVTVNGKIDRLTNLMQAHNEKHEEDMKEVRLHINTVQPILENYETFQKTIQGVEETGKFTIGVAVFITSVGAAWLMIKQLIMKI